MKSLYIAIALLFLQLCSIAQVKYVTNAGAGLKNGSSWADAWSKQEFGDSLYLQASGIQVWLAKGSYLPTKNETGGPPTYGSGTFAVPKGVKIYGGFAGNESSIDLRDPAQIHNANKTVLSGDIGTAGFQGDNLFYAVTMKKCSNGETLDGLSISYAINIGLWISFDAPVTEVPVINNCIISDNFPSGYIVAGLSVDGGVNSPNAELKIQNCYFANNRTQMGGALKASSCKMTVSNSVFTGNFYINPGTGVAYSGISIYGKTASISNCTFLGNTGSYANPNAAAISIQGLTTDSVYLQNNVFWKNTYGGQVRNLYVSGPNLVAVRNSLFQTQPTGTAPASESGNFSADPLFVNETDVDGADNMLKTADDGLALQNGSPCIDKGKNEFIYSGATADFANQLRVKGCRVDAGAYENQAADYIPTGLYSGTIETCTQYPVGNSATVYVDTISCHAITSIVPNGAAPLNGLLTVCVKNDPIVQVVNGRPYVQRHYDIIPSNNAANATARITIYFTQADFDAYNTAAGTNDRLPTGPADAAGIANIRVEQNHGISLTGVPGTYSGSTVFIDPADNDITWNATSQVWEVTFDVTGFSGFFLTSNFSVLPVVLHAFSGALQKQTVKLQWNTSSEINTAMFSIEKSADAINFTAIGNINASGKTNGAVYHFIDPSVFKGTNYYRLRIVDNDRSFTYSQIIAIDVNPDLKETFTISPNPAKTNVVVTVKGNFNGSLSVVVYDITGKMKGKIFQGEVTGAGQKIPLDITSLPKGVYILEFKINNSVYKERMVVL